MVTKVVISLYVFFICEHIKNDFKSKGGVKMRVKDIVVTGLVLSTLVACGTNNDQSLNDRNWDNNVEPVRNRPNQMEQYDTYNGTNQYPGAPGQVIDRNQQDPAYQNGTMNNSDTLNGTNNGANGGNQGQNQYQVADRIAEQVNQNVDEIDQAYVLTMGDTAYVACEIDNNEQTANQDDLADDIEQKVTEAVQDADQDIENVFVSSNPDFVNLTSNYMRDVDRGRPVEGFFDQFGEMIDRIFPGMNR